MNIASNPIWFVEPQTGYQINSTAISADGSVCLLGTSREYDSGQFAVYCYDSNKNLLWSKPITDSEVYQGVFWVAVSANGQYGAAGGIKKTQTSGTKKAVRLIARDDSESTDNGFLNIYDMSTGENLLALSCASRVNQVAMSDDGSTLVAVAGSEVILCQKVGGDFERVAVEDLGSQYGQSCQLSADGCHAVVGTTNYDENKDNGYTGQVLTYSTANQTLTQTALYQADVGIQRVALCSDSSWWAASTHSGQLFAFSANVKSGSLPVWTFTPDDKDVSLSYAVAIGRKDEVVYFTLGVNLHSENAGGRLYTMQCQASSPEGSMPTPCWQHDITYGVNPGVNMDRNAEYVTATDGQPGSKSDKDESAGDFYLFKVNDNSNPLLWSYKTDQMNWPMSISANGNAIFGASDNGYAYFWA
ncbi:hypothetical protein [Vibrio salinus]|uniref:hypothetical protein n=1 Tax=Vibrio salinus TaxID=2899784 RepID=UPI001E4F7BD9|nr:hypothetical protein [Vibrio salinus]MCE0496091.1 hypothetical protein [Vibrio salinus]